MNNSSTTPHPLVILGAGYTARWVYQPQRATGASVTVTSRHPDEHLDYAAPSDRVCFDLARADTWHPFPPAIDILWSFPAEPPDVVAAFAHRVGLASVRRLVVLGSTSAYAIDPKQPSPPPWTDESAPLDLTKPRVQGEEWLRQHCGAIVLRVAGIYGPGRNPLDWIRRGRVGPTSKYVNLVHVEDLASICLRALDCGTAGEAYNVSDGVPRTWSSICEVAAERFGVQAQAHSLDRGPGKRIAAEKLRHEIDPALHHPDLFTALDELDRAPHRSPTTSPR